MVLHRCQRWSEKQLYLRLRWSCVPSKRGGLIRLPSEGKEKQVHLDWGLPTNSGHEKCHVAHLTVNKTSLQVWPCFALLLLKIPYILIPG